jgi:[protein-PII] uridylyltransferase
VNTEVIIDNEAAPTATIIDVYTRDRPGLLCEIAQTIREAGVLISFSRINTEGLRVADVFYVTDEGGHKIRDKERLVALRTGLVDMLSRPRLRKESG